MKERGSAKRREARGQRTEDIGEKRGEGGVGENNQLRLES